MRTRSVVAAGVATVTLAAGSVAAVAAVGSRHPAPYRVRPPTTCSVPSLPGRHVTVMLGDMPGGSMMGGRALMRRHMVLRVAPWNPASGTVSIVAVNHGSRAHELVVLPLAAGAGVGTRAVGPDDTVDESGSLGEASRSCGGGAGDGIRPRSAGWLTLRLAPGRYELLCNLPGHYAAGMYAELDVT